MRQEYRVMSSEEVDDLKRIINEVLDDRHSQAIDEGSHIRFEELLALREFIRERQERHTMVEQFKKSFIGGIAVALVTGLIAALAWIGELVLARVGAP